MIAVRGEAAEVALGEAQAVLAMVQDDELGEHAGLEPARAREKEAA